MRLLAPPLLACFALLGAPAEAQEPARDGPGGGPVSVATEAFLTPDATLTRKDGESGSRFPVYLPDPTWARTLGEELPADRWLMLTGTGVREKFWFDVYTVGLYLDPLEAHHALAPFHGSDGASLAKNSRVYAALARDDLHKLLRLEMNRDVSSEDMREAFDDSLAPRIREAARSEAERAAGLRGLDAFKALFGKRTREEGARTVTEGFEELAEGTVLRFAFAPGGVLTVAISHRTKRGASTTTVTLTDRVESPLLCAALLDVYLGEDPVSGAAKKAFATGLPAVLERGAALDEAGYPWPRPEPLATQPVEPEPDAPADGDGWVRD